MFKLGKNKLDTSDSYEYLTNKYMSLGLLLKIKSDIDYIAYPDEHHIPICAICLEMYNHNGIEIKAEHLMCGCLWFDYIKDKILKKNPNVKFIRKK